MVQVYLSLDKLAAKLAQVNLLRTPSELRSFAQRFNVNQPLFNIIDVGHGKERADHKIKGLSSSVAPSASILNYAQRCYAHSAIILPAATSFLGAAMMLGIC